MSVGGRSLSGRPALSVAARDLHKTPVTELDLVRPSRGIRSSWEQAHDRRPGRDDEATEPHRATRTRCAVGRSARRAGTR